MIHFLVNRESGKLNPWVGRRPATIPFSRSWPFFIPSYRNQTIEFVVLSYSSRVEYNNNQKRKFKMSGITETLSLRGTLKGHNGWITSLATTAEDPNLLLSSSRDKSVIVWQLTHSGSGEDMSYGYARRALRGHSHFVSDVVISSDGAFALSASWDSELRLWDIATGKTTRRFVGHDKDVLSVAFSVDNRQIVSGT